MDMLLTMSPLGAASLYVGVLIFQLMSLKGYVSINRYKHKVASGDVSNPDFARAARVQANAVEDVPALMIGILTLGLLNVPPWQIHAVGLLLVVSRILHAIGLGTSGGLGFGRREGTFGTVLVYVLIGGAVVVHALGLG